MLEVFETYFENIWVWLKMTRNGRIWWKNKFENFEHSQNFLIMSKTIWTKFLNEADGQGISWEFKFVFKTIVAESRKLMFVSVNFLGFNVGGQRKEQYLCNLKI